MRMSFYLRPIARCLVVGLIVVSTVGCNSDAVPVSGRLTFEDGEPIEGARIVFRTSHEGKHVTAFATTDEDGQYALTTWQTDDGAVPGEHRVIVTKPRQPVDGSEDQTGDALLPAEIHEMYAGYHTTPIRVEVKDEDENEIDLTVVRPD